jgi:hypothetical protein
LAGAEIGAGRENVDHGLLEDRFNRGWVVVRAVHEAGGKAAETAGIGQNHYSGGVHSLYLLLMRRGAPCASLSQHE